jgi:HTH-like domain/Integrase core domain
VAGVSRSCFYEHKYHVPSDRQIRRLLVSGLVADIHKRSRGTYGMLRIRAALVREHDMVVNKKLILSIMRELGIKGLPGPKKRKKNLVNEATEEDLVQRHFTVDRPNVLWLTDITEHPTREGKVYCCAVLDAYSRRVVGWAIDRRCESALVKDAVSMASDSRAIGADSVLHSDHGSQGEFNWSSQHLDHGGVHGTKVWMASRDRGSSSGAQEEPTEGHPHISGTDTLPGSADDRLARRPSSVLGSDRSRAEDRCCRYRGERLIPRRV